jgi:hypothetical protein
MCCLGSYFSGKPTFLIIVVRNSWQDGVDSTIPCPKLIKDYHLHMGGVDVHDQLRLQRYSVQLSFTFKKYYKTCVRLIIWNPCSQLITGVLSR